MSARLIGHVIGRSRCVCENAVKAVRTTWQSPSTPRQRPCFGLRLGSLEDRLLLSATPVDPSLLLGAQNADAPGNALDAVTVAPEPGENVAQNNVSSALDVPFDVASVGDDLESAQRQGLSLLDLPLEDLQADLTAHPSQQETLADSDDPWGFILTADESATAAPGDTEAAATASPPPAVAVSNEDGSAPEQHQTVEWVFIDTSAEDYQQLVDDLLASGDPARQFEIVYLDAERDGIQQITDALAGQSGIDAVHLVAHGTEGAVKLGSTWLDMDNMDGHAGNIAAWGTALDHNADLLFYGCDLADGDDGRALLDAFQTLTGADIAASVDDTGSAARGGDWLLEYSVGEINTAIAFSDTVQQTWTGLLSASQDSTSLWLTTDDDVSSSGAPGLDSWTDGEVINLGDPNLSFGITTDGTLSSVVNFDAMGDGDVDIDAIHYVGTSITVGSANSVALQAGDLLLSTQSDEVLTSSDSSTLSVSKHDVFVFRPDVAGDYSLGTFTFLLEGNGNNGSPIEHGIRGISLVESDTTVGVGADAVTLQAGSFLVTTDGGSSFDRHIWHFEATNVGFTTTTGSTSVLIDGDDLDFSDPVFGVDIVENDNTLNGQSLAAGQILVTTTGDDSSVASNGLATDRQDIFVLDASTVGLDNTDAPAQIFLDGSDIGLDSGQEEIDGLTLFSNSSSANAPPTNLSLSNDTVAEHTDTTGGFSVGTLTSSDPDGGETFNYSIVGGADSANFSVGGAGSDELLLDDGVLDFETKSTYEVVVRTTDSADNSYDELLTISVSDVNENPVAGDDAVVTDEDTPLVINAASLLANDSDVDLDTLTIAGFTQPASGTLVDNGDGTFTYTPDPEYNGPDSFNYTVNDGNGGTDSATVNITVNPQNDNPVAAADAVVTDEDTPLLINAASLLANDSDVDLDTLTIAGFTQPASGTLVDNGDGTFTYTPDPEYNGSDSFGYTLMDGLGGIDVATVNITVNPQNDSPVAVGDAVATNEDTPLVINTATLLANDSDVDLDTLVTTGFTQPGNGTVVDNGDGTLTYMPAPDYNGPDGFTYTISDGNGGTASAAVNISVTSVNDTPVAGPDEMSTSFNTPLTIRLPSLLANDSDVDLDALTIANFSQPANGRLFDNGDGTLTYVANPGFTGQDVFFYAVTDGAANSSPQKVTITVRPDAILPPVPDISEEGPATDARDNTEDDDDTELPVGPGVADPLDDDAFEFVSSEVRRLHQERRDIIQRVEHERRHVGSGMNTELKTFVFSSTASEDLTYEAPRRETLEHCDDQTEHLHFEMETGALWQDLDELKDQMEAEAQLQSVVVEAALMGSVSLTAGYVIWVLRGAVLMSTVLAQLPAWQFFDPLPVLDQAELSSDAAESLGDSESLDSIIQGSTSQVGTFAS